MALIGTFNRTRNGAGYAGRLRTLTIDTRIVLTPAPASETENAPDFRIHRESADGAEIGAGWKRTGEKAGDYVSLQIDDPTFGRPIRANLFQADDDGEEFHLLWSRPSPRKDQD